MKSEHIQPFVNGAYSVLEMLLGATPRSHTITAQAGMVTCHQVNAYCGVTGELAGHVIVGMSLLTADRVASKMIGQKVQTFDALASSAIAELANMICGNALLQLSELGVTCDLAPPSVIRGTKVSISSSVLPAIVIPMQLEEGELTLVIGIHAVK